MGWLETVERYAAFRWSICILWLTCSLDGEADSVSNNIYFFLSLIVFLSYKSFVAGQIKIIIIISPLVIPLSV